MTTVDAFQHLCRELDRHQAGTAPEVRDLLHTLYTLRDDVSAHQPALSDTSVSTVAARMRDLTPVTPTPLLIDTALDCETQLPQAVIAEVPCWPCTELPRSPTATSTGATPTADSGPGTASAYWCR